MNKVKIFANSNFTTDHNGVIKTVVHGKEVYNDLAEHCDMVFKINRKLINKIKKTKKIIKQIKNKRSLQ